MDEFIPNLPLDVISNIDHAEKIRLKIERLEEAYRETINALGQSICRYEWDLPSAFDLFDYSDSRETKLPFIYTARGKSGWTWQKINYAIQEITNRESLGNRYIPGKGTHTVYVLLRHGVCVYIGRSRNVKDRLKQHRHNSNNYDDYQIYICKSLEESKDLEAILQQQHRPIRNKRIENRTNQ
jgi:hypothetical protein